jgi:hypothetical protein
MANDGNGDSIEGDYWRDEPELDASYGDGSGDLIDLGAVDRKGLCFCDNRAIEQREHPDDSEA